MNKIDLQDPARSLLGDTQRRSKLMQEATDFLASFAPTDSIWDFSKKVIVEIKSIYGQEGLDKVKEIYEICEKSHKESQENRVTEPKYHLNNLISFATSMLENDRAIEEFRGVERYNHQIALTCSRTDPNFLIPYFKAIRLSKSRMPIALEPGAMKNDFRKQTEVLFANYPEFRSTESFVDTFHDFVSRNSPIAEIMIGDSANYRDTHREIAAGIIWHLRLGLGEEPVLSLMLRIIEELPSMTYTEFVDICESWETHREMPLRWTLELFREKAASA